MTVSPGTTETELVAPTAWGARHQVEQPLEHRSVKRAEIIVGARMSIDGVVPAPNGPTAFVPVPARTGLLAALLRGVQA